MSHSFSSSSFCSSSYSFSSASQNVNGEVSGRQQSQHITTNPSGTTVRSTSQTLGEAPIRQVRHFDNQGRETIGHSANVPQRRIEDVSETEQARRDEEYKERMEDEYAKREGGA